jgi:hypothetical protein
MDSLNNAAAVLGIISGLITIVSTISAAIARLQQRPKPAVPYQPPYGYPYPTPTNPGQGFQYPPPTTPNYPAPSPNYPPPAQPTPSFGSPYPASLQGRAAVGKQRLISYPLIALGGAIAFGIYAYNLVLYAQVGATDFVEHTLPTIAFVVSIIPGIAALIQAIRLNRWGWLVGTLASSIIPGLGGLLFGIFGPTERN